MKRAFRLRIVALLVVVLTAPLSLAREPLPQVAPSGAPSPLALVEPSADTAVVRVRLGNLGRVHGATLSFDVGEDVHVDARPTGWQAGRGSSDLELSFDTPYPLACDAPATLRLELDDRQIVLRVSCGAS